MRLMHILVLLSFLFLFGCGGGGGSATGSNPYVPPTGLSLAADYPTLAVGTATFVSVIGSYAVGGDQEVIEGVTLVSDDPAVTIVGNSILVADSVGSANITATWERSGFAPVSTSLPLEITITDATVSSIAVSSTPAAVSAKLPIGASRTFTATGTFSDLTEQVLFHNLDWVSGTSGVAEILEKNPDGSLVVRGLSEGTSFITADLVGIDDGVSQLTVVPELVLASDPSHLILGVDDSTAQLTVTRTNADGSVVNETESAVFTFDNPTSGGIPSVILNPAINGQVTGLLSVGAVEFTATLGGVALTYDLAVISP